VHTWRDQVPDAGGILHLGATSCFVTDNSELIQIRDGLDLVLGKLREVLVRMRRFALERKDQVTVGFTHFQPAQFTTVGKRAALWLQDLVMDARELSRVREDLRFRGVKGTTGTQDSFLKLFDGDEAKVKALDEGVARRMGFERTFPVCGQTYPRKQDWIVMQALSGLAQSAGKFSSDMRLLCHLQEVEEPFGKHQIGSSAMAYKRNPMRSERMAGLSRWLITLAQNAALTASTQWMERTLDDSANRRLTLGEGFLCADALLELYLNVTDGLVVRDEVVRNHVQRELPFIASEEILMAAVRRGGDRQDLHEVIRAAAVRAQDALKSGAARNPFLDHLSEDAVLGPVLAEMEDALVPERFCGRAPAQVREFVEGEVDPLIASLPELDRFDDEVRV
jgi:adenylosuccinate lyase